MLWGVCFFNYADRMAISAVLPVLEHEFRFDKQQLGLISSAFMVIYAGASPLAGMIGDRLRRKTLIIGGFLFWSTVTMLTGWARTFWQFYIIRALEGFGEAFYFPASMAVLGDYHSGRTRSRAMSIHQSSVYLGTIGGTTLGGLFAEHWGWRTGFYLFGGLGMVLAVVLGRALREPRRGQAEPSPEAFATGSKLGMGELLRHIFRTPVAPLLMLAFVGANFVATTFLSWMPTFLYEKFHMHLAVAGLTGTVFIQLASAVGSPLGGVLADRLARRYRGGRMLVQALGLLSGAGFVFLTGTTREVGVLMFAMSVFGFCKGLYDANIFASLYDVVDPRARASAAGLMNCVGWAGGAMAPALIGRLVTYGGAANEVANFSRAIAFGGIIYLVGAALLVGAFLLLARRAEG